MSKTINIAIADDHKVLRQGLISLLEEYDHLKVIIDANDGRELLDALKGKKPDIILLDIEMPVMNGKEALEKIKIRFPQIKVIIMSMHFDDSYIIEFIQNGANAFLPKNCDIDKILDAIQSVHELGYYYDSKVSLAMADMLKKIPVMPSVIEETELTKREKEILKLICLKKSNNEIASILNLSVRTIEGHRLGISKKTNTSNLLELIEFTFQNKLF